MTGSNINIESSFHSLLDPEVIRFKVIKMIVCMKLLYSFAKNKWFTKFCQHLNLGYVPTSSNTDQGAIIKDYDSF